MKNEGRTISDKKKKVAIAISVAVLAIAIVAVVILTVDFVRTKNLYMMTSRSHKIFAEIEELDAVEGIELTLEQKGVEINGIKVAENREYVCDKITVFAYVVEDASQTNKLLEFLIGENSATIFNLSEGFGGDMMLTHMEYYVFSGQNLLIMRTKFGAAKMNDLVVALDSILSVEVTNTYD